MDCRPGPGRNRRLCCCCCLRLSLPAAAAIGLSVQPDVELPSSHQLNQRRRVGEGRAGRLVGGDRWGEGSKKGGAREGLHRWAGGSSRRDSSFPEPFQATGPAAASTSHGVQEKRNAFLLLNRWETNESTRGPGGEGRAPSASLLFLPPVAWPARWRCSRKATPVRQEGNSPPSPAVDCH